MRYKQSVERGIQAFAFSMAAKEWNAANPENPVAHRPNGFGWFCDTAPPLVECRDRATEILLEVAGLRFDDIVEATTREQRETEGDMVIPVTGN